MSAPSRRRQLLGGFILAVFGMAMAFGIVEAGVRLLHLVPDRFWQPDPLLGTALVPEATGWWTQEEHEFFVPVTINAAGRRDLDRQQAKPPGTFRILLLGDSFVEALQVPIEETFARGLERALTKPGGPTVEVVSLGVSGYGTASQYLWYREVGHRFDADLVLLSFYPGNDVRNNSPTLEPALKPVYDSAGELQRVDGGAAGGGSKGGGWSKAYTYLRKLVLTRQPVLAGRLAEWGLIDRTALRPAPMYAEVPVDYWVFAANAPPEWQDAWRRSEGLLTALRDAVRADGAELVVMVVTAREQVYPADWEALQNTYPAMRTTAWDLDGPEQRVLAWCADADVACVALSPAFRAARDGSPRLHWQYDGHWTAAGHALAAQTMAHALAARVPARPTEAR